MTDKEKIQYMLKVITQHRVELDKMCELMTDEVTIKETTCNKKRYISLLATRGKDADGNELVLLEKNRQTGMFGFPSLLLSSELFPTKDLQFLPIREGTSKDAVYMGTCQFDNTDDTISVYHVYRCDCVCADLFKDSLISILPITNEIQVDRLVVRILSGYGFGTHAGVQMLNLLDSPWDKEALI